MITQDIFPTCELQLEIAPGVMTRDERRLHRAAAQDDHAQAWHLAEACLVGRPHQHAEAHRDGGCGHGQVVGSRVQGVEQLTSQMPFGIYDGMKSSVSIDKAGRVVLPQHVRRQFHLVAGDRLGLELQPDGIFLRSHAERGDLVEDNGLLVHEGEPVGDLAQAIDRDRASRDADVLGVRR